MIDYIEIIDCISNKDESKVYIVKDKNAGIQLVMREILYSESTYNLYSKLRDIKNPYLPIIYDVQTDKDKLYIIEEYAEGVTISKMIGGGHIFSDAETKNIALMLCDVLSVLHNQNIVHRDIKPSNIIYTTDNKIKLIDFGAARIYDNNQNNDTKYLGTVGYAPPEQYGFCQTDIRADIYSLGITLFEMLTGKLPNSGVIYNGKLSGIIQKCIAFDPKNRFENVVILKRNLLSDNKTNLIKWNNETKRNVFIVLAATILVPILVVLLVESIYAVINYSYKKAEEKSDLVSMQYNYDTVMEYKKKGDYSLALSYTESILDIKPTTKGMQKMYDDTLNIKRELEETISRIKAEKEAKCTEMINKYVFNGELAVNLATVYDESTDIPSLWYYSDTQNSADGDYYRIIQTSMSAGSYLSTYYAYANGKVIVKYEMDNRDIDGYTKATFKLTEK